MARVRSLSNLECVGETLRAALDDLAQLAPDWLVRQISLDWFERYSHRVENYRLPKAESQRMALAQQIGADGLHLLQALEHPEAPAALAEIASVQVLRQVWQQYDDLSSGKAKWRAGPQESSDEGIIRSPYDPEARTGKKRETTWLGYKVHLTETCALETTQDPQAKVVPQLITDVQTTVANVQDVEMTAIIQENLAKQGLLPDEQIVDTGYIDADLRVRSHQNYGIRLLGPVLSDNRGPRQSRQRLRRGEFPPRLAREAGYLSAGSNQLAMGSGRGANGSGFCARDVCCLSGTQRLHEVFDDWPSLACAPTSGACRLAGAATRTRNVGVSESVSETSRYRGDTFPSGTRDGHTTRTL